MTHWPFQGFRADFVSARRHIRAKRKQLGSHLTRCADHWRELGTCASEVVREMMARWSSVYATPVGQLSPATECLEPRRLLSSVSLSNSVLTLSGDSGAANSLTVDLQSNGGFWVNCDGHILTTASGAVKTINITGGSGADYVYINPSIKIGASISLSGGNDTVRGGGGYDTITAADGSDTIYASGKMTLGNGNNVVWVGSIGSYVQAGNGNNLLVGGPGNDTLIAGSGHNTLIGGSGADSLEGGAFTSFPDASSQDKVVHLSTSPSPTPTPTPTPTPVPTPTPTPSPTPTSYGSASFSGENETVYGSNHGDSLAPTPVMVIQGTGGQAEHSVFVNALSSSLASGDPLTATYSWNFGDSGSRFNVLPGWNAGHIYNNAGTYTITLTITNSAGHTSSVSAQITIASSSRKTIYVDSVYGNDSNNGLSSSTPVKSWQRADQLLTNNTTVLFRRGETWDFGATFQINNSNVTIGAYGSGNAPDLVKVPGNGYGIIYLGNVSDQVVIENLTFDSVYTPVNGSAPEISATGIYAQGRNNTIRDNTFLNIETAVDAYMAPSGLLVQDNSAPLMLGLRGYFVWMNGSDQVILGNTVVNSTREHILRSSYTTTDRVLIAGNNFANPTDGGGDPNDAAKTTINIRAGSYVYIADNTLSNATIATGPDDDMPANTIVPWFKFDGNILHNSQFFMHGSVQHAMISNNFTDLQYYQEFELQPTDPVFPNRQMLDITLTHNTGTQQGAIGSFLQIDGDSPAGVITVTNNLFAAPNLQPGDNFATSVMIKASNANAVAWFNDNVWAATTPLNNYYCVGSVNYISPGLNPWAYLNATEWNNLSNVGTDAFRAVSVTLGGNLTTSVNGTYAGAVLPARLS